MTPTHYQTGDRPHAMDIIESFLADDTLSALEGFFLGCDPGPQYGDNKEASA